MMTESRFINPPSFPRGILPSPDFKLLIEMIIQFNVILFELFRFLPLPMRTQWKEAEGIKKIIKSLCAVYLRNFPENENSMER